jgi:hypothetical protein
MEDRYEKVLFSLIDNHKETIKKAERKIERLKVCSAGHPDWKETHLNTIEATKKMILERRTKIDTIWVCLNHYRSLLGVNHA